MSQLPYRVTQIAVGDLDAGRQRGDNGAGARAFAVVAIRDQSSEQLAHAGQVRDALLDQIQLVLGKQSRFTAALIVFQKQ